MENINHDIQKDSNNIVIIKEEEIEIEEEDVYEGDHNQDIIIGTPKPCEKLNEIGPTPFLTKTYEMVDDPNTCHIVSWGVTGSTFIVWDPHKFSTDLIPKYFKHSNFSSFIRQLNTYGFRKVHFDRWEFANAGFLKGQKHLLKAIKRRTHGANSNSKLQVIRETTEIENLKKEQQALQGIINDLKQQQQSTDKCLAAMEERMKSAEWKQKKFLLLIAKTMRKTPLFQQLLQTYRQKKALNSGEVSKKRRLAPSESLKDSYPAKTITQNSNQCQKDDSVAIQLEPNLLFNSLHVDVSLGSSQDQKSGLTSDTDSPDLSSGSYIMWEKLIEDDVVCVDDNEEDTLAANETNLVHELQNLIAKPPTWGSLANVAEVACPAGQ